MVSEELQPIPVSRYPAALQLTAGALGAGFALAFACPALGVASLGALADGERFAKGGEARTLRWASLAIATLASVAIAVALIAPVAVPGWVLIVVALVGILANAACVVAAFPLRLSQLADAGRGASASGFAALFGVGVLLLARPAGWVCIAGAVAIALAIAWGRLTRSRSAQ
ncbi:MAG: hypothetical protein AMJ64_02690 [Betaproteobacteria bacterium SG8_39]|nr:MAG: hypothetical protein AMJ64_02690 [Betaproteobacteria bacterium SG8_39]